MALAMRGAGEYRILGQLQLQKDILINNEFDMISILHPPFLRIAIIVFFSTSICLHAENWDRFRGPNGSGVSEFSKIPTSWSDEDYLWKIELPGTGNGSPVVWGENLFVNCASEDGTFRIIQCRSTESGELLWEKKFASSKHKTHKFNSYASSTPCVDSERVYTSWGTPDELVVIALTHDGELAWEARDLGKVIGGHGFGTSPIVHDDLVIIANDTEKESSLIALNKKTGQRVWEAERPGGRLNFATPAVYHRKNEADLLIFSAWPIGITAINSATGGQVWEVASYDVNKGQRAVASPIIHDGLIFANCAFVNNPKHLVVLKPSETSAEEVFRIDHSTVPHIPSLLVYDGLLFAWADKGICTCYEVGSGKKLWQQRVGGNYFSSPVCADGIIYCIDVDGHCVVIQAAREYKELNRIDLGEACRATPAIADHRMYIRTFSHLMAVGSRP